MHMKRSPGPDTVELTYEEIVTEVVDAALNGKVEGRMRGVPDIRAGADKLCELLGVKNLAYPSIHMFTGHHITITSERPRGFCTDNMFAPEVTQ
jgi:hypothetical protein